MKTVKFKCGCVAELHREAWVSLCPMHEAETKAIHERWALEHKAKLKDFAPDVGTRSRHNVVHTK